MCAPLVRADLIVQWDVARKRTAIDYSNLLNLTWWEPWYEFVLVRRLRAQLFRPMPAVDAGVLSAPAISCATSRSLRRKFCARDLRRPSRSVRSRTEEEPRTHVGIVARTRGAIPALARLGAGTDLCRRL
jgi:hypothetical protein